MRETGGTGVKRTDPVITKKGTVGRSSRSKWKQREGKKPNVREEIGERTATKRTLPRPEFWGGQKREKKNVPENDGKAETIERY